MNAAARPVRCGRCKASYTPTAFASLPKLVTLEHDELTPIVSEHAAPPFSMAQVAIRSVRQP